ncbi:unnamed protein product [Penicillium salamii]|nr:unnamed protein product [Penicillium salamii]
MRKLCIIQMINKSNGSRSQDVFQTSSLSPTLKFASSSHLRLPLLPSAMTEDSTFNGFELTPADYTFPMFYSAGSLSLRLEAPETGVPVLRGGIERLISHHPFLAGVVLPSVENPGTFRVARASENLLPAVPMCTVKLLPDLQIPSSKIAAARKDEAAYDRNHLLTVVPVHVAESSAEPPVIRFQINVLGNGLILGIFFNHTVIDGTGFGILIQSLAICCREHNTPSAVTPLPSDPSYEESSRAILATIGRDIKATKPKCAHPEPTMATEEKTTNNEATHDMFLLDYDFHLSAAKIEQILEWTRDQTANGHSVPHVSADDIVTAVLWQCLGQFRGHTVEGSPICVLQRVLNARRRIQPPLSTNYLGNCFIFLDYPKPKSEMRHPEGRGKFAEDSFIKQIGSIACFLRSDLNTIDDQFAREYFSKYMTSGGWPGTSAHTADVVVSSVRRLPIHEQSFGDVLGQVADFEILPYMNPEGVCTIKPHRDANFWEVLVTLEREEMSLLRSDPMFGWLVEKEAPTCIFEPAS